MTTKKIFLLLLSCILLLFLFPLLTQSQILANTILFQDDFDDGNADGWEEISGTGGWEVINGEYVGTVTLIRPERPAMSSAGEYEWSDYRLDFDIKSISGVDKGVMFRYQNADNFYVVNIRSMSRLAGGNDIVFQKIVDRQARVLEWIPFVNYENTWYHVTIILNGPNVKIYVDNELKINYIEYENILRNGKVGLIVWPGGHTYGEGDVTTLVYDNIIVSILEPSPSPDPIILLPGLGASWNHGAMIAGNTKPPEEWYMTPFVKAYDGFIQTLKNTGYEEAGPDKNLFVFNYDWRQPIETIAIQLEDYIESTVDPPTGTKIDLIGHSLGGMVARTYVQNNPDHQVDQLITIGSPHKGAPKVYYLWEGADLKRVLAPWQRIGAGILLHLNKRGFQNNVETIQAMVPVLRDLLPTFSYLRHDRAEKPLSEMRQKNNWLEGFNQLPLPEFLTSVFNAIIGVIENSTLLWIDIEDRNRFDQILGKWEDGKPVREEFDSGDKTVLVESAQIEGANVTELFGLNHGGLVESTDGQGAIIDLLGLSPSDIISAPEVIYEPSLVFQIASSANLTVFDPDSDVIAENEKLVFIPDPKEKDYTIQVNPENSGGEYLLLIGKITEEGDSWTEFSGDVTTKPKIHKVTFTADSKQIKLELLDLANKKLLTAQESARQLSRPIKIFLTRAIEKRIKQVEEIIALLNKNRENQAQIKTRQAIFSISILEKNLRIWARIFGLDSEIQNELRIAKNYLLQVYEFE